MTSGGVTLDEIVPRAADAQTNSATITLDCCHAGLAAAVEVPRDVVVLAGAGDAQPRAVRSRKSASHPTPSSLVVT